jgi:hypothetical protein
MTLNIVRIVLVTLLLVGQFGAVFAKPLSGFPYHEIESWHDQGMVFVVRDAQGHIVAHAKGKLEKWVSESHQIWVVRDSQGRFMTFARGSLETWKDGSVRLVLRNKEGKFVAVAKANFANNTFVASEISERDVMNVIGVY